MRNMHRWAAQGMVIAVFLHMCRVFYTGSYKPPREFNWVVGVLLLVTTFLLSFTGYLLPWDQLALLGDHGRHEHWRRRAARRPAGRTCCCAVTSRSARTTLIRFYTLHVIFLPLVAAFLMAVHFWRIRKDGGISGPL